MSAYNHVLTAALSDTFTAANSTTMSERAAETGGTWHVRSTANVTPISGFYVQSNQLTPDRHTDGDVAYVDTGLADFVYEITATPIGDASNGSNAGIIFRMTDINNYWFLDLNARLNRADLLCRQGSSTYNTYVPMWGYRGSSGTATVTTAVAIAVKIVCKGQLISIWMNDVHQYDYTSTLNQTATQVGVRLGKTGTPASKAIWDTVRVTAWNGLLFNHPLLADQSAATPILPAGASGAWDDGDVNDPNVLWDGSTWQLMYSGAGVSDSPDLQDMGLASSSSKDGPWTKNGSNPVFSATSGEGAFAMNGGITKKGATYYQYYTNAGAAAIGLATSADLQTWTRQNGGTPVITPAMLGTTGGSLVSDAWCWTRPDSTIEIWFYGQSSGGVKTLGRMTTTDGTTMSAVEWFFSAQPFAPSNVTPSEPSVYYPFIDNLNCFMVFYDGCDNLSTRRFINCAVTMDNGAHWYHRARVHVPEGSGANWHAFGVFDSFPLIDSATFYLWYAGSNPSTLTLNNSIKIGYMKVSWPYSSVVGN